MIVSFSSCFPQKSVGSSKMTPTSSSRDSAAASEIHVYIHDDNHNYCEKENIADQRKRQLTRIRRDTAKKADH